MSVLIQSASHPHNFLDHGRDVSAKALVLSTASAITLPKEPVPLGLGIPLNTPHAISCSIPTWADNYAFMAKDERVTAAMKTGYPRSFIHPSVQKLLDLCEQHLGVDGERCLLFPSLKAAELCRDYVARHSLSAGSPVSARVAHLSFANERGLETVAGCCSQVPFSAARPEIHATIFPLDAFQFARQFMVYAGMGISSRLADCCLALMAKKADNDPGRRVVASQNDPGPGAIAKLAMRARIAELLRHGRPPTPHSVSAEDVFLYPNGMCGIWNVHNVVSMARPTSKSVCFGFSYTDTMRIMREWAPGCHFFGHGSDADLDELEKTLAADCSAAAAPPIFALFTEFPSNPLLRCPDLARLRVLADKYDFLIVIDDTIGNFVDVDVFQYADITATSLSKSFSGSANVLGGSVALNPAGRHYQELKSQFHASFEDIYFDEDAICMELNSRDLPSRLRITDANTEAVCDLLRSRSIAGGASPAFSAIKEVFYPKWTTREKYDSCRSAEGSASGSFGSLCSVIFTSAAAAHAFYDSLLCYKGPSLGTNFTLVCPYTLLGHFNELEWASGYGVEENLVRISVGMEDRDALLKAILSALVIAEQAP
ncbi:hypothetical protein HWV62_2721 [Athelia sp. TMB]|nr:hypothetical protein HWV62_2721 [Athelia sp. TMB]